MSPGSPRRRTGRSCDIDVAVLLSRGRCWRGPTIFNVATTDRILDLVRRALDEFDDRPLEVSVRRTLRIATLLGETKIAVRLVLELKPVGGHAPANAEDVRGLM